MSINVTIDALLRMYIFSNAKRVIHLYVFSVVLKKCKMFINNRKSQEPPITIGTKFRSSATSLIRGLAVFSLRFLVFLCILRFRIFKVRVLNASE